MTIAPTATAAPNALLAHCGRSVPRPIRVSRNRLLEILRAARSATLPADHRSGDEVLARLAAMARPVGGPMIELHLPVEILGDLLTVAEHTRVPLPEVAVCYVGDGADEHVRSLLLAGALLGMDVRIAAPVSMWPDEDVIERAEDLAAGSGARLLVTSDAGHAVLGADIVMAGTWGAWSVLPIDQVAPPAFTVSDDFLSTSGLSTTATLLARPYGRGALTAPRSLAADQIRNRQILADVVAAEAGAG